jgi:large subunit ribosomal protein L25
MANPTMQAKKRTVLGKKVKVLRREGHLPGVVYGPVMEATVPVIVDRKEFVRAYQAFGHSTLLTLTWEDGQRPVFIRDVQMDYIKKLPVHVDFFAPNLQVAVRAMVPLVLHNPNDQVDGVVSELVTEIEVEAKPEAIPHQVDADISALIAPGDSFRISDLTLPEGATATGDPETVLVHVSALTTEAELAESQALPEPGATAAADAEAENAGEAPSE